MALVGLVLGELELAELAHLALEQALEQVLALAQILWGLCLHWLVPLVVVKCQQARVD
jgi:hypothetical protein